MRRRICHRAGKPAYFRQMTAEKSSSGTAALLSRHWQAFVFVLTVIVPLILRTGKRPVIFSRYIGMGDIICTIPAARELMKRHPGATFIYDCRPDFTAVQLENEP